MGVCAKKACPAKQDRASAALHHPFNIQKYASPVTGRNRRNLPAPAPSEPQLGSDFQGRLLSTGFHPLRLALPFPDPYSLRPCLSDCQPVLYNNARPLSRGGRKKGALPVREAGEGQLFFDASGRKDPGSNVCSRTVPGESHPRGQRRYRTPRPVHRTRRSPLLVTTVMRHAPLPKTEQFSEEKEQSNPVCMEPVVL